MKRRDWTIESKKNEVRTLLIILIKIILLIATLAEMVRNNIPLWTRQHLLQRRRELFRSIRWKRDLESYFYEEDDEVFKWEKDIVMRWRRRSRWRETLLLLLLQIYHKGKTVTIYYNLIFLFYFSWWDPLFRKMEQSITSVVAWCAQVCMLTWGVW